MADDERVDRLLEDEKDLPKGWKVVLKRCDSEGRDMMCVWVDPTGRKYYTRSDARRAMDHENRREQPSRATAGFFPHHESRRGPRYQAIVPALPLGQPDGGAPDLLRRVLDALPSGASRTVCCEEAGTPVWSPHVLPERTVAEFLAQAKSSTSPFARFDAEAALTLLATNNYDVQHTLSVYRFMQDSISRQFLDEAEQKHP